MAEQIENIEDEEGGAVAEETIDNKDVFKDFASSTLFEVSMKYYLEEPTVSLHEIMLKDIVN